MSFFGLANMRRLQPHLAVAVASVRLAALLDLDRSAAGAGHPGNLPSLRFMACEVDDADFLEALERAPAGMIDARSGADADTPAGVAQRRLWFCAQR